MFFQDEEVGLLTEVTHLGEIMESLVSQAEAPRALPPASEQVITDLKGSDCGPWNLQQVNWGRRCHSWAPVSTSYLIQSLANTTT